MKSRKLTIRSDGTGQGTFLSVGGVLVEGVRSLDISINGKSSRATITIQADVDFQMCAQVVAAGHPNDVSEARHLGKEVRSAGDGYVWRLTNEAQAGAACLASQNHKGHAPMEDDDPPCECVAESIF